MASRAYLSQQVVAGNLVFDFGADNNAEVGVPIVISVPAAKTGTLTTRTSDTVGTLTMAAGHGIITGDKLDIYWTVSGGGKRIGVTVGTVVGDSVPFTVGTGDILPANNSAITAKVPLQQLVLIPLTGLVGLACKSPVIGVIRFLRANGTEEEVYDFTAAGTKGWVNGSGVAVPITADIGIVSFSHGQTTAQEMSAAGVYN